MDNQPPKISKKRRIQQLEYHVHQLVDSLADLASRYAALKGKVVALDSRDWNVAAVVERLDGHDHVLRRHNQELKQLQQPPLPDEEGPHVQDMPR